MKLHLILLTLLVLASCSTDVDLYADYEDTPVVYGLINYKADTNYVKITRTFCGDNDHPINAYDYAPVFDSNNYPGKLVAFFDELRGAPGQTFQPTGRRIFLDTLTIHNKKEGIFFAPHQRLYFTTERFNTNNASWHYRYRLCVVKPDYDTVHAETGIVGGDISVGSTVNFQAAPSHALSTLLFSSTDEAVLYQIVMQFHYLEQHAGQPMERKEVTWSYGARPLDTYEKVLGTDNFYRLYYSVNSLFNELQRAIGNDTVWDANHPNVTRYIDDFFIYIAAAGEDFNNWYQTLQGMQSGLSLSSGYSNVNGGYGFLSSRIFVKNQAQLSSFTKLDLFKKPWGFIERKTDN